MMRLRLGLKVLGLCALAAGAMGVVAGAAQGEAGSNWRVNGANINSTLLPELKATELEGNDLTLLSELSKKKVELLCTGTTLEAVKLGAEGKIGTGASIVFTGCIFNWGGVLQKKCTPHGIGNTEGTIRTEKLHGLFQLHEIEGKKEGTVLLLPDTGEVIATIILGKEGVLNECAAGEKLPLSGKLSLKDANKKLAAEEVTHLVGENPLLTDLWILNKTAEHKATVDGSAVIALTNEAHAGLKWSGVPKAEPEEPGWRVNGVNVNSILLPELKVTELEGNDATLLAELSGKKVELLCTGAGLEAIKFGTEGTIDAGGSVVFTGCVFKWGGILQTKCTPHGIGNAEGTIRTEKLHGLIQSHEIEGKSEGTALISPDTGEVIAMIILGKEGVGNECAAGEKLPLSGKLLLKDAGKKFSTEEVTHLVTELPALTDLWILNKTAEHKATVDGSAVLALTNEAHTGLKWSGIPKTEEKPKEEPKEEPGWRVNGTSVNSTLLPELKITELEGNDATLLSTLAGKKLELLCTAAAFESVKLGTGGEIDAGAKITFTGCVIKWGGTVQSKCVPHSAGAPEGTIKIQGFHGIAQLHEGEGSVLVLPDAGESFITFIPGKEGVLNECALGEKISLSGKLALKDANKKFTAEETTHLVVELATLTDLWILNKTAEHKVTLDGSAVLALTGASHTGLKWSGLPT